MKPQSINNQQPDFGTLGNDALLYTQNRIALFCSNKCPGDIIIKCQDWANNVTGTNTVIVSGFHTPVEQDVLRILLRGKNPAIICPPRALNNMRLPATWKEGIDAGTLCIAADFPTATRRANTRTAEQRNRFVAGLAEIVLIPYAAPGGKTESLAKQLLCVEDFICTPSRVYTFDSPYTQNLVDFGCQIWSK